MRFETLEARRLLAADFLVNAPEANLGLQRQGDSIQVLDLDNHAAILRQIGINDIDSQAVEIIAKSFEVSSEVQLDGNSLSVRAEAIRLINGGGIFTADLGADGNWEGNSGDITLVATSITIDSGSSLRTRPEFGDAFQAGTIVLAAVDQPQLSESLLADLANPMSFDTRSSEIRITDANIVGRNVSITSVGASATRWDDLGGFGETIATELTNQLQTIPQLGFGSILPLSGNVKQRTAVASLSLTDARIRSDTFVTLSSEATADATNNTLSIGTSTGSTLTAIGFSRSEANATIELLGVSEIIAGGNVDIRTHADANATLFSRAEANSRLSANGNIEAAFNIALAWNDLDSKIDLGETTTIDAGGSVTVDAGGKTVNKARAATSIFQDGTGGLSVAVGVDNADVSAEVKGKITSRETGEVGQWEFAASDVDANTNEVTLRRPKRLPPLRLGQSITYNGPTAHGLITGVNYIVDRITDVPSGDDNLSAQRVRLVGGRTIDLNNSQTSPGSVHRLSRLKSIRFDAVDVSIENDSITLPSLPAWVTQLTYLGPDWEDDENATAIGGLQQNQTYQVERSGDLVRLRSLEAGVLIDLTGDVAGEHGFHYMDSIQPFDPRTAVDNARDTIELSPGHGLQTGDLVWYATDPMKTVDAEFFNADTGEVITSVSLPDAPIDGLENGYGYRVVVDPDSPNRVLLVTTLRAAELAGVVDLTVAGSGGLFADSSTSPGILVSASLDATNAADAGISLSDFAQPWPEVLTGIGQGQVDKIISGGYALVNSLRESLGGGVAIEGQNRTGVDGDFRNNYDLASSIAVPLYFHAVHATIATTAVLTSWSDIVVNANIKEQSTLNSTSEATRRGVDDSENGQDPDDSGNDTELSLAVGYGHYVNLASAMISDNAQTDAARNTSVTITIDYPMLVESALEAINPVSTIERLGLAGFDSLNDGILGLSNLLNVQAKTLSGADGDSKVFGGAVVVTDTTNNAIARIGEGANVNQNDIAGFDADSVDSSVTVESRLTGTILEAGQMAAINVGPQGLLEAATSKSKSPQEFLKQLINPFGVQGAKAIGGIAIITLADHRVVAEIGNWAMVSADAAIDVEATSSLYNLSIVQTGVKTTDFGFSASIAASDINLTTLASIGEAVSIDAGSLHVLATDNFIRTNIVGAFLMGKQIGIGVSIGVNVIDQDVRAAIGRRDTNLPATVASLGYLNASGVEVKAISGGAIFSLVMAGAVQGISSTNSDTTTATRTLGAIALDVPVAINQITADVDAYVDRQVVDAAHISVAATTQANIRAIVVGASIAVQGRQGNSRMNFAGVGAVAVNTVHQHAAAFIRESDVSTNATERTSGSGIHVVAIENPTIQADAGGLSLSASLAPTTRAALAAAVSVAINDVTGGASAIVRDSTLDVLAGDLAIDTASTGTIKSLALAGGVGLNLGGTSAGGVLGGAGAGVRNDVNKTRSAELLSSTVEVNTGSISVIATDQTDIRADAGGFGLTIASGSGGKASGAIGIALALNNVTQSLTAKVDHSTLTADRDIVVQAGYQDKPHKIEPAPAIHAWALAADLGVGLASGLNATLAGAGSGAHNIVSNSIEALATGGSNLTVLSGDIQVLAFDFTTVDAWTVGASLAVGGSSGASLQGAVGISIAKNDVTRTIHAAVIDSVLVASAGGEITVQSTDNATIDSVAVAASASISGSKGVAAALTGGGADATNRGITNQRADVTNSSLTQAAKIIVKADSKPDIDASVYGVFVGLVGAAGPTGSAAIGASLATNLIGVDASDAPVPSGVFASLENSSAVATESIHVEAIANANVNSIVLVVSVAVAGSAAGGATGSGSGARTRNRIAQSIHAKITSDGGTEEDDLIDSPLVRLQAKDTSNILSDSDSVIVAVVGSAAASGSLTVGVSLSDNRLSNDIEASFSGVKNLRNSLSGSAAGLLDIDAGQTATINASSLNVIVSGAFSTGSAVALSGGGSQAENVITNQLQAIVKNSDVPMSATVDAISNNDVDALVKSVATSASGVLAAGAAAVGFVVASNTIGGLAITANQLTNASNKIIAEIRGSTLSGGSQLRVKADSADDVNASIHSTTVAATVGLTGAGGVAVDLTKANNLLASDIQAGLRNSTVTDWNSAIPIEVAAIDSVKVNSDVDSITVTVVGGKNAASLSASVGLAEDIIANDIDATVRDSTLKNLDGTAINTGLSVLAQETANVTTDAFGAAVAANVSIGGSINGGGVIAYSEIKSKTLATIELTTVLTTEDIDVTSSNNATANAKTHGTDVTVALIGIGGTGSFATSRIAPSGDASVTFTHIEARDLTIQSTATPGADAHASGLTLSTGLAVGVSDATVELAGNVNVNLQNTALSPVHVRDLKLISKLLQPQLSKAYAQGSTGGILIGVDSTVSKTDNTINVNSTIGDGSVIFASGQTMIDANRTTHQAAHSSSVAGAIVAVGVTKATTIDNGLTLARIGAGVSLVGDALDVKATSHSQNDAFTIGANGGLLSVPVSIPATTNTVNTRAEIGDGAVVAIAGNLNVLATATATFNTRLQASAGGVLTGGGGDLDNTVTARVVSAIGAAAQLTANSIDVRAETIIDKPDLGSDGNVHAITGGAFAGLGVDSRSLLTLRTSVTVAADAVLRATNSPLQAAVIDLHALNSINATDRMTLISGGLASGGGTFSRIEALVDKATIMIEAGASIYSDGEVNVSARGDGNITIQSNSDFWGAATLGLGASIVHILPHNEVVVRGRIWGDRDVNLSAGTDTAFNHDVYKIESRLDTFAGSIIPVNSISAEAFLIQNNTIDVTAGAEVLSGGDVRMHAERFGDNHVIARMKAVNWITALAGAIDNAVAEGGREVFRGTAEIDAIGTVNVDGIVRTGIRRNRILEIESIEFQDNGDDQLTMDDYVVTVAGNSTLDVPYQVILTRTTSAIEFEIAAAISQGKPQQEIDRLREELELASRYSFSNIDLAIAEAESQLAIFGDNATLRNFYQDEIIRLQGELAKQGLFGTPASVDPSATTTENTRLQREAIVIRVEPFIAQAGSIEIVGDRRTGNGTLDAPGDARVEITNHTLAFLDIAGISIPSNTGGVFFNGLAISVPKETPTVHISNSAVTNIVDGVTYPWPSITISGDIENLGGEVTLANEPSGDGSITINATLRAAKQTIIAGNGTVTINLPGVNTAFEAAGAAHASIAAYYKGFNPSFNGTVPIETQPSQRFSNYLNQKPVSPSLIGDQIFISAEYINVNGLIQSGKSEYRIVITDTTATEIEALRSSGATGVVVLQQESNSDFRLSYDFDTERILVSEVRAGGGYIDLTGRIANTRNGQLQAFGGYASIIIDNRTTNALQLNRLDVSQRGVGTIVIKDKQRGTSENPAVTIYRYRGDQVEIITPTNDQVISIDAAGDLTYQPANGLRYQWIVAQDNTTRKVTTYASSQWLGFVDFIAKDPPPIFSQRTFPISQPRVIEGSSTFYVNTSDQTRYGYQERIFTKSNTKVPGRSWEEWSGWGPWSVATYYNEVIETTGTLHHHRHRIKADRPIDIDFTGSSEGEIRIRSDGDVFIAGHLNNPTGHTQIGERFIDGDTGRFRTAFPPSVNQVGTRGLVAGRTIGIVTSRRGIVGDFVGASQNPILTDLATESMFDFTSSTEPPATVYRTQRVLVEAGHVSGGKPGAVYQFIGDRAQFDLGVQDYSNSAVWKEVQWDSQLRVITKGSAHLREVQGDLVLGEVRVDETASLTAQRSLLTTPEAFVFVSALNLHSQTGNIGIQSETEDRGFRVTADLNSPELYSPIITAQAAGDIFFDGRATLQIKRIITPGDVRFDMTGSNRVIDGNPEGSTDERAIAEITQNVWVDLQLTVQHGADDKLASRIQSLEAARTQDYRNYWQFRSQQAEPAIYNPSFQVRLTGQERDFYGDEATITTIENSRTQQYHDLHVSVGGISTSFDTDYRYVANDGDRATIVESTKVWTEEELTSLSPATSLLNVSDTEFVIEQANITARNVIINSDAGVGSFQNGTVIKIPTAQNPTKLSLYEQALIASAEPEDFVYLRGTPILIPYVLFLSTGLQLASSTEFCGGHCITWPELGFVPGDTIFIESNNPFTENRTFTILGTSSDEGFRDTVISVDGQTADFLYSASIFISHAITNPNEYDQATHLIVQRREDLDLDLTGSVSVRSSRNIFLGSESDLTIDHVDAGTQANRPRVQIKVGGSLSFASSDDSLPHIRGQQIVLEASEGAIGSVQSPLRLSINEAGNLIARADGEIVIKQISDSSAITDLAINQIFSRQGFVDLETTGSIVDAFTSDNTNIQAPTIVLRAGGQIGQSGDPLEIETSDTGTLTATAGGDIRLSEATGNMNVRQVLSQAGDVFLTADFSILDAVDVQDPYDPFSPDVQQCIPGLPVADVIGRNIVLNARLGSIGTAGNELDIDSNYNPVDGVVGTLTTTSGQNSHINETAGDLYLNMVHTDEKTAFIAATTGSIYNGVEEIAAVVSGGKSWLFARDDIGQASAPLRTSVGNVEAITTTGSLFLLATAPIAVGGVVESSSGGEGEDNEGARRFAKGLQVAGRLELISREPIEILEDIFAEQSIHLRGSQRLSLPVGVRIRSREGIEINTAFPAQVFNIEINGTLDAPATVVRGGDQDDIIIVQPEELTGKLMIFGGLGSDSLRLIIPGQIMDLTTGDMTVRDIEKIDIRAAGNSTLLVSLDSVKASALTSNALRILADPDDTVIVGAGWRADLPTFIDNRLTHIITEAETGGSVRIELQNGRFFQNPLNRFDVDRNGRIEPLDALQVLNSIRRLGTGQLALPTNDNEVSNLYPDVSGDNELIPLDALLILNAIARINRGGEPEGEMVWPWFDFNRADRKPSTQREMIDIAITDFDITEKVATFDATVVLSSRFVL